MLFLIGDVEAGASTVLLLSQVFSNSGPRKALAAIKAERDSSSSVEFATLDPQDDLPVRVLFEPITNGVYIGNPYHPFYPHPERKIQVCIHVINVLICIVFFPQRT